MIQGTHITATVNRVVDGDTIRVFLPDQEEDDESLRILALDTEESNAGSSKPVTPFGKAAKQRAEAFFSPGDTVTLEFPGHEDVPTCLRRYRGNFGQLLVFVYKDGVDFQETMIREGFSPYFVKYGNAVFGSHHMRYQHAERQAQRDHIGVWDPVSVNGSEIRNYAVLGTWWQLRANLIDVYRHLKPHHENLFNSRLDFGAIVKKAQTQERVTVFTELRSIDRVSQRNALIRLGSIRQPFSLFVPNVDEEAGQAILHVLASRYITTDAAHPRRSYAYVSGALSTFRDNPQMVVTSMEQITDNLPTGEIG